MSAAANTQAYPIPWDPIEWFKFITHVDGWDIILMDTGERKAALAYHGNGTGDWFAVYTTPHYRREHMTDRVEPPQIWAILETLAKLSD